jgi:ribonuclease BN (tRNA processing enzyme)
LITHGHSDHIGGFPFLIQAAWLAPRQRHLPVYLPEELIEPLRAWLEAVFLPASLLGFPLDFHPWRGGVVSQVCPGIAVDPFPTTHLDGLRQIIDPSATDRFKVFGLAAECNGRRVVFSSDLGGPEDMAGPLKDPCDVLVCELSHFDPEVLFAFLAGRPVGKLVLNHLSGDLVGREDELEEAGCAALGGIPVEVVRDGGIVGF